MHPIKYGAHHHHLQPQQFMEDDDASSSASIFFISNPHNHQQQSVFPYPLHSQQHNKQHENPVTHQLFHHQFQPFQHPEPVHHHNHQQQPPFLAVNFKLGLNENSGKKEAALPLSHLQNGAAFLHGNEQQQQHSLFLPRCLHPQEDSPIKEPFW